MRKLKEVNYLINKSVPDIIIEYKKIDKENFKFKNVATIYVRPEANELSFEKAILKGVLPYADVIYMANLNGLLFIRDAMILEHYASQYRFAIYGVDEIKKYPEMVKKIEEYFNISINSCELLGAFDAILKLNISAEELFNTYVDESSFLKICGQTIKKIKDIYIINYDLPAILEKYNLDSNVFIIVIEFKNNNIAFNTINYSIAAELFKDQIEDQILKAQLLNKAKRIYHISTGHIMAMYDMIDFVYLDNGKRIKLIDTPLGFYLINNKIISEEKLLNLKEYPLVNIPINGKRELINVIEDTYYFSFEECIELFKNLS